MKHTAFLHRLLSVLLCAVLLIGTVCFAGIAAETSGTCGEDITCRSRCSPSAIPPFPNVRR